MPVSGIYHIQSSHNVQSSCVLQLKHCVDIEDASQYSSIHIVYADRLFFWPTISISLRLRYIHNIIIRLSIEQHCSQVVPPHPTKVIPLPSIVEYIHTLTSDSSP